MKRGTCLILIILLITAVCAAAPAEAPASQFSFKGWPYRQSTPCQPASPGNDPADDADAALIEACKATACPVREEAAAAVSPTAKPTKAPTVRPTSAPTARPSGSPSSSTGDYTTTSAAMQEQKAWNLLNQDRARNGLAALPLDSRLSELARLKACDMKQNHYFAHTSPTYGDVSTLLATLGANLRCGENIARYGTIEKAHAALMTSVAHRRNILAQGFNAVGIAAAKLPSGGYMVVQIFGKV